MRSRAGVQERGFVTVEIIASIAVLSMMGFGVFGLYRFGIDQLRVSTERTVAVRALENEAELLRAVPVSGLSDYHGKTFGVEMVELKSLADMETLIAVGRYEEARNAQVVKLSVTWRSHAGRKITEELSTLRAF